MRESRRDAQGEVASAGAGSAGTGPSSQVGQADGIHQDLRGLFEDLKLEVRSSAQRAKVNRTGKRAIKMLTEGVERLNENFEVKIPLRAALTEYKEFASGQNPQPADVAEKARVSNSEMAGRRGMTSKEHKLDSQIQLARRSNITVKKLYGRNAARQAESKK